MWIETLFHNNSQLAKNFENFHKYNFYYTNLKQSIDTHTYSKLLTEITWSDYE